MGSRVSPQPCLLPTGGISSLDFVWIRTIMEVDAMG